MNIVSLFKNNIVIKYFIKKPTMVAREFENSVVIITNTHTTQKYIYTLYKPLAK